MIDGELEILYLAFNIILWEECAMAKKKLQKGDQNKLVPQKLKVKGELLDDSSPENYEMSEELAKESLKKSQNKEKQKKNK